MTEVPSAGERARLALIEQSVDVLATFDATGACTWLSKRARQTLGTNADRFDLTAAFAAGQRQLVTSVLPELLGTGTWAGELAVDGPTGTVYLDARLAADRTSSGHLRGWTLVAHDITAVKALHADLVHRATHDALTDIPNRALFVERLDLQIAGGSPVTVVYLDLDGFKAVNDTLGHDVGDRTLVEVARRLQQLTLAGGLVARLGGDEFVVIPPATWADPVAELRRGVFADAVVVDHREIAVGARFGVATSLPGESGREVLVRADRAMYEAKRVVRRSLPTTA